MDNTTGKGEGSAKLRIQELEKAHKQALVNLLQAIRFRYLIYTKLGKDSQEWKKYADLVFRIGTSWHKRQMELEKSGGLPKENIKYGDLFTAEGNKKLTALVKKWDAKGEGIGFIPLLIWGVIALVGFFTADKIVDELNTTTEEQKELIEASDKICKEHNFNADECKAFMTQQTQAVTDSGGGMLSGFFGKFLLFGGIGLATYTYINKNHK